MIGKLLNETYRVERVVGTGSMGAVFEVEHTRLGRRFALKVMHAALADKELSFARFRREAQVASKLTNPNIVEVVDYNISEDGQPYLVMELIDGETLRDRVRRERIFELEAVRSILRQLAEALDAAHDAGVIHRDLKPANILLCERHARDDFVKVLDFGISKVLGTVSDLTKTNVTMGTAQYMAPEQASGKAAQADRRADVYAIGAIVYEMLAGAPPVAGGTLPEVLYHVVYTVPTPLRQLRSELPAAVSAVVAKALAKQPRDRYPTAGALWTAFDEASRAAVAGDGPTEERTVPRAPAIRTSRDRAGRRPQTAPTAQLDHGGTPHPAAAMRAAPTERLSPPDPRIAPTDGEPAVMAPEAAASPMAAMPPVPADADTLDVAGLIGEPAAPQPTAHDRAPPADAPTAIDRAAPIDMPTEVDRTSGRRAETQRRDRRRRAAVVGLVALAATGVIAGAIGGLLGGDETLPARRAMAPAPDGGKTVSSVTERGDPRDGAPPQARTPAATPPPPAPIVDGGPTFAPPPRTPRARVRHHPRPRKRPPGRRRPAARLAVLQVITLHAGKPMWANVYVDGKMVGQSPLRLEVQAGSHTVRVARDGIGNASRRVRLPAGARIGVRLELVR